APLVVPERGGVRVQVAVGGPGETGSRSVEVYSLREDVADEGGADVWTRHATGMLSTATAQPGGRGSGFDFAAWPPPGAQPVDISDGYGLLAQGGYGYGPAFQGVLAVWRRGEEIFAEVALPEEQRKEAGRFGIHPALLDAALHSTMLNAVAAVMAEGDDDGESDGLELRLPFAWNGLELHAAGASVLRVRVGQPERDALSLEAVDEAGGLVVTMDSLVGRVVSAEQLETAADSARANSLFQVGWTVLPPVRGTEPTPSWVAVSTAEQVATLADDVTSGATAPAVAVLEAVGGDSMDAVLVLACQVLEVVQCWLAGAGLEESRLVVLTRGAVPAGAGGVSDPAGAAVWGLVRAAQAEHPDRIILLDSDPTSGDTAGSASGSVSASVVGSALDSVLGAVLASGEPQIAVRGTVLTMPRLARATGQVPDVPAVFGSEGTVLVSGAGALGALAARHLVARYGVRRLLLA
ncbi:polyketide synthase dehydratase domain-containing protein, partial [Streptomyces sp. 2A115]|uniref:polyketide synthase dehydratase domain-containing protein n=1 Tax=Streptomyces sp. 2A115 TaxID=3457439 RepID=UPI003FCF149E